MKKILILFITLLLYPQQSFSKAQCPVDISMEHCCASKSLKTLADCQASCSGTCIEGYYASCYYCDGSDIGDLTLCYPTLPKCNQAITLPEQYCQKFGSNYCIFLPLPDDPEPTPATTTRTVVDCPAEGTFSTDGCCCNYQ
ncbi:MAG: hypothetical protein IJ846_02210 [Alphaproteobacteria bacterium]|nr:hypothetical protein [Alphaproteobacteria bacterium]